MTGGVVAKSLNDPLVQQDAKVYIATIIGKRSSQEIQKRPIDDPMSKGEGPVDHLIGKVTYTLAAKEVLYPQFERVPDETFEVVIERVNDLLHYPPHSRERSELSEQITHELAQYPAQGDFIFRTYLGPHGMRQLYLYAPLSARAAFEQSLKP